LSPPTYGTRYLITFSASEDTFFSFSSSKTQHPQSTAIHDPKGYSMKKHTIARIVPILPVSDLERAMSYYRRLGFSADPHEDGDECAFLTRDRLEIHLRTESDLIEGQNPSGVYFYLAHGNATALEAEFRAARVPILSPLAPRESQMNEFVLSDPDGNLLRFGEDLAKP
jgi:hypothetical protein